MVFSISNDTTFRPLGFEFAALHAGIKPHAESDLAFARVLPTPSFAARGTGASVVGFFARDLPPSPAVRLCRRHLVTRNGDARALLVHAGIANCEHPLAADDAESLVAATAQAAGLETSQVLLFGTGIRGAALPLEKICARLWELVGGAGASRVEEFARAIATDGQAVARCSARGAIDGHSTSILGLAKGGLFVHPRLATLLMFLFTDAPIAREHLQGLAETVVERTLHTMSIDGHASPCDSFVVVANAGSGGPWIEPDTRSSAILRVGLDAVAKNLVQQLLRAASSARIAQVSVSAAPSIAIAAAIAQAIALDADVKHSIATSAPAPQVVLSAIPPESISEYSARLSLALDGVHFIRSGRKLTPDETVLARLFRRDRALVQVDLGTGSQQTHFWTATYPRM